MAETKKVVIEIDNLTESQALALEDLLAVWQRLGGVGSSRWTAFYADGDGNFRPKITIDGRTPEACQLGHPLDRWKRQFSEQDVYAIDFDEIAWALHP